LLGTQSSINSSGWAVPVIAPHRDDRSRLRPDYGGANAAYIPPATPCLTALRWPQSPHIAGRPPCPSRASPDRQRGALLPREACPCCCRKHASHRRRRGTDKQQPSRRHHRTTEVIGAGIAHTHSRNLRVCSPHYRWSLLCCGSGACTCTEERRQGSGIDGHVHFRSKPNRSGGRLGLPTQGAAAVDLTSEMTRSRIPREGRESQPESFGHFLPNRAVAVSGRELPCTFRPSSFGSQSAIFSSPRVHQPASPAFRKPASKPDLPCARPPRPPRKYWSRRPRNRPALRLE
jgi:hypothetical protein